MDTARQRELAKRLAELRCEGRQQSGLAEQLVPPDKETAYRVARLVEEELGWEVGGWKIAAMKAELQRELRTDSPIYGRVYAQLIKPSPVSVEHAKQCSPIPEVEYQAVLGCDLPPRAKPYAVEEVTEAVASLHPGIELAECRFVHDASFPPLPAILADGAGSGRKGSAGVALDHPMVPLTWLANELSRTGIALKAGQFVSTGTLTGMLRPKAGETYVADFGPFGSVTARYV
jgi:2-oxo-hept-3-ene-1,7-dioate hydratase